MLSFSSVLNLKENDFAAKKVISQNNCKVVTMGKKHEANAKFMSYVYLCIFTMMLVARFSILLLFSGNIYPHPGLSSATTSVTSSSFQASVLNL